jgi:hypothetical protein
MKNMLEPAKKEKTLLNGVEIEDTFAEKYVEW